MDRKAADSDILVIEDVAEILHYSVDAQDILAPCLNRF